jgi:hypothetical protein
LSAADEAEEILVKAKVTVGEILCNNSEIVIHFLLNKVPNFHFLLNKVPNFGPR